MELSLRTEVSRSGAATLPQTTPIPEISIYLSPVLIKLQRSQFLAALGFVFVADPSGEAEQALVTRNDSPVTRRRRNSLCLRSRLSYQTTPRHMKNYQSTIAIQLFSPKYMITLSA